jgi:hypothetical protein
VSSLCKECSEIPDAKCSVAQPLELGATQERLQQRCPGAAKCHSVISFAAGKLSRLGRYAQAQKSGVEWLCTDGQWGESKSSRRTIADDG